jgi:predicted metal-binding membrane protein
MAAGIYQLTPWKRACLSACQSPAEFIVCHWHTGRDGALRLGLAHGASCLGCCWALMLLLFVGGVMNLTVIAGLTIYLLLEKLMPRGAQTGTVSGVLLVAWGIWMAVR